MNNSLKLKSSLQGHGLDLDLDLDLIYGPQIKYSYERKIQKQSQSRTDRGDHASRSGQIDWGSDHLPFPIPRTYHQALQDCAHLNHLGHHRGSLNLRREVSQFYSYHYHQVFAPHQFVILPSLRTGLQLLGQILEKGRILFPCGSNPLQEVGSKLIGQTPHWVPVQGDKLTVKDLLDYFQTTPFRQRNQFLILPTPNLCSGIGHTQEELEAILEVCHFYGVTLIIDTLGLGPNNLEGEKSRLPDPHHIPYILSGGAKALFASDGHDMSYLYFPPQFHALNQALDIVLKENQVRVATPIQEAMAIGLYNVRETHIRDSVGRYLTCTQHIMHFFIQKTIAELKRLNLACSHPQRGVSLLCDFEWYRQVLKEAGVLTSKQLCHYLKEKFHLLALPGEQLGLAPERLQVRFSLTDLEGDQALAAYLQGASLNADFIEQYAPQWGLAISRLGRFALLHTLSVQGIKDKDNSKRRKCDK